MKTETEFGNRAKRNITVSCQSCGADIATPFRKTLNGHDVAWLIWWSSNDTDTIDNCLLLCRSCHIGLVRNKERRIRMRMLSDGPMDWFTGLRALQRYIMISRDYRFTSDALDSLRNAMLKLNHLPTSEGFAP